jgi:hypothetical protein
MNPERSNELSDFVAWIGETTGLLSGDMLNWSDDPHPRQLTLEGV